MEAKLKYLLDRSEPFSAEKVQILDQLTNSMKLNSPDVIRCIKFRQNKPTKYGEC